MKYSIITPVYNREDCISRCIESVIRNISECFGIEHIIVDDGSKDNTPLIVQKYANEYSHIRFIEFPENRGTNAARNAAIREATGDFCIILDSDDYFVDDAVRYIDSTIIHNNQYRHFMFSPDDMQGSYLQNELLNKQSSELVYEQFLAGDISGDFVHVISIDILKKCPFDESLRIYEGLFFLRFYRDAEKMLFSNRVVTIRERNREDSVTRESIRTNKRVIERKIKVSEIFLKWYSDDLAQYHKEDLIYSEYINLLDNLLLLSEYEKARNTISYIQKIDKQVPLKHKMVYILKMGWLYRMALKWYLVVKYDILKTKLR